MQEAAKILPKFNAYEFLAVLCALPCALNACNDFHVYGLGYWTFCYFTLVDCGLLITRALLLQIEAAITNCCTGLGKNSDSMHDAGPCATAHVRNAHFSQMKNEKYT